MAETRHLAGCLFRVDARAEGDIIMIGGWEPQQVDGRTSTQGARWFSIQLDRSSAPWAYCRGEPYRTVSALELLGTACALALLGGSRLLPANCDGLVTVTGFTDSAVASNVLVRGLSTSFPLCVVVMEVALRLERLRAKLSLEWVPREMNKEADALSNGKLDGFSADLRVLPSEANWVVLDRLMAAGTAFHAEAKSLRAAAAARPKARQDMHRRGDALRVREPW